MGRSVISTRIIRVSNIYSLIKAKHETTKMARVDQRL
jgi:hypothetical protein